MIWKGAIDNGTGVAALINIAEKLKNYSDKEKLGQDIVFCAFNGEESFFQGSKSFVEDISSKYENLCNINIDSVGVKDGGKILIDGETENNQLANAISTYFTEAGFDISLDKQLIVGSSDHIQFIKNGINGIGLSQEGSKDILHTLADDIDKVDIEYIEKLGTIISNFIIDNSYKTYSKTKYRIKGEKNKNIGVSEKTKKIDKIRNMELETLEFNQYKYIEIEDVQVLVRSDVWSFNHGSEVNGRDLKDFYNLYPQFSFSDNLGDYRLKFITVYDKCEDYIKNPEIDKVYEIDTKLKNIQDLQFTFARKTEKTLENYSYGDRIDICFEIEEKDNGETKEIERWYDSYNEISDDKINIGDEVYNLMHSKESGNLNGLCTKVETSNKNYLVVITSYYEESWQYKTIDEIVSVYKELQLKSFIRGILDVLT